MAEIDASKCNVMECHKSKSQSAIQAARSLLDRRCHSRESQLLLTDLSALLLVLRHCCDKSDMIGFEAFQKTHYKIYFSHSFSVCFKWEEQPLCLMDDSIQIIFRYSDV